MGRTAQPAALKLLAGRGPGVDSGGRPVNEGPLFVREAPDPPDWLGEIALAEWHRIVPELSRLRLVTRLVTGPLANYCEQWQVFVIATKTLHEEGYFYEAKQGILPHPAVAQQRQAGAAMHKWAVEFGLTPASEQRIKPVEADDGAESDAII